LDRVLQNLRDFLNFSLRRNDERALFVPNIHGMVADRRRCSPWKGSP
jgi:hypothetical protein